MHELQHLHLVPGEPIEGDRAGARLVGRSRHHRGLQVADPAVRERRERPLRGDRAVERDREEAIDQVVGDDVDGFGERVVVGHPGVAAAELAPQRLQGRAGRRRAQRERLVVEVAQFARPLDPSPELPRHRALAEQAGAVEVVHVVDRVRDVVGDVHDRALERLHQWGESAARLGEVDGVEVVRRELRDVDAAVDAAHPPGQRTAAQGAGVDEAGPRVLRDRRPDGGREVEPVRGVAGHVERRDDPVGLRVALESVGDAERLAGEPVEHPLADMAERRVPEVVRARRGLHDDGVAAVLDGQRVRGRRGIRQADRDRARDRRHLDRVGEPVVDQGAGARLRDHLRDRGQSGEVGREPDPLEVEPELRVLAGDLHAAPRLDDATRRPLWHHRGPRSSEPPATDAAPGPLPNLGRRRAHA